MRFAEFYQQFINDRDDMGADECCAPGSDEGFDKYTTPQIVDALIKGNVGVDDVGHELAKRGALGQVPGDHWGYD